MPLDPSQFADSADMPTEILDEIYSTELAPDYFDGTSPSQEKRAILVGGQPGAGKSSVTESLSADMGSNYITIDADELRSYVPGYVDKARSVEQAHQAASWSHAATQYFTGRLLEDSISHEVNFVYDSTLAKPDKTVAFIERLANEGYKVDVGYVCTHRSISERGVQQRYFDNKQNVGSALDSSGDLIPRYVPNDVQAEAIDGLSATVDAVDRYSHSNQCVHLSLWERSPESGKPAQQIPFKSGEAAQAREEANARQLSNPDQLKQHFREWNKLAATITNPSSRVTLEEFRETTHVYAAQLERHDWKVSDRFKDTLGDPLTVDKQQASQATLEIADGEKSTTLGEEGARAIEESGAKEGEGDELESSEQINTHRNKWNVKAEALNNRECDVKELVQEHPDLVNEVAAIKVAEKFSQKQFNNDTDRDRFMDKVRTQIAGNVSKGQQSPEVKLREERAIGKESDNER